MAKFREIKVKFIPTKIIMSIPEPDLIELLKNDRGNFEIIDNDFDAPKEEIVVETTTYDQVVENNEDNPATSYEELREKELKKLKVTELIAFCDEKQIAYEKTDKKADLIEKIIKAETTTKEA